MSDTLYAHWRDLADRFAATHPEVSDGRMMAAEALLFAGRVFVFFSERGGMAGLGCRLGRDFDIETLSLADWRHLAPFKTKPPMKDWIVAGDKDRDRWPNLMEAALTVARQRQGGRVT